jgi:hypothetical protein
VRTALAAHLLFAVLLPLALLVLSWRSRDTEAHASTRR